jgi:hypothetical protein
VICGGLTNTVAGVGNYGIIGGGQANTLNSGWCSVLGGRANSVNLGGDYSTIGGGYTNVITGNRSTICGGDTNTLTGNRSAICGGDTNTLSGDRSAICGGDNHVLGGDRSIIGGGGSNVITAAGYAAIAGGQANDIGSGHTFIGGGQTNTTNAGATHSVICGGLTNAVAGLGNYGVIAGGQANTLNSGWSAIPGGRGNSVSGNYSVSCGYLASDGGFAGCFSFADSQGVAVTAALADSVNIGAAGGTYIYSDAPRAVGTQLLPGANAWAIISDRDMKENIEEVDYEAILQKVDENIHVYTYQFKDHDPSITTLNVGTMAQEFATIVDTGKSDKLIDTGDLAGVTLATVIALRKRQKEILERLTRIEAQLGL